MFPVSASLPPQAMALPPYRTPSPPRTQKLMHKNDLNCYCQRLSLPIPVYETKVEGYAHALRFRATVSVGEKIFTSSNSFANRKSAEQGVAKLALQHLLNEDEASATKLRLYLRKLVCQDKARCKMILNEFLDKIKMECAYKTVQVKMLPPAFVSSLALNGTCYKGEAGKNKKEAEQLAALAAILSLLDDPTSATSISEVLKSKFNVCAASYEIKDIPNTRDCSVTGNEFKATTSNSDVKPLNQQASSIGPSGFRILVGEKMLKSVDLQANNIEERRSSEILVNKNKQYLANSLPQTEKQGGAGLPTEAVTISRCSYVNLPITRPLFSEPQHEIKLPDAARSSSQQISVPIESVQAAALDPAYDLISSKKRKRNKKKADKKKANKRLRVKNK